MEDWKLFAMPVSLLSITVGSIIICSIEENRTFKIANEVPVTTEICGIASNVHFDVIETADTYTQRLTYYNLDGFNYVLKGHFRIKNDSEICHGYRHWINHNKLRYLSINKVTWIDITEERF